MISQPSSTTPRGMSFDESCPQGQPKIDEIVGYSERNSPSTSTYMFEKALKSDILQFLYPFPTNINGKVNKM